MTSGGAITSAGVAGSNNSAGGSTDGNNHNNNNNNSGEKVRLELFAHALVNAAKLLHGTSNPFAVVTLLANDPTEATEILGKTEVIARSLNPRWTTYFDLMYNFTKNRRINVGIYDAGNNDAPMGSANFEIGEVLGSKNNIKAKRLRKGGSVFVRVTPAPQSDSSKTVQVGFRGVNITNPGGLIFSKTINPFYEILTQISPPGGASGRSWQTVYRSEHKDNEMNPSWKVADIPFDRITGTGNGSHDIGHPILFKLFSYVKNGKHQLMGEFETSVRGLLTSYSSTNNNNNNNASTASGLSRHEQTGNNKVSPTKSTSHFGLSSGNIDTSNAFTVKKRDGKECGKVLLTYAAIIGGNSNIITNSTNKNNAAHQNVSNQVLDDNAQAALDEASVLPPPLHNVACGIVQAIKLSPTKSSSPQRNTFSLSPVEVATAPSPPITAEDEGNNYANRDQVLNEQQASSDHPLPNNASAAVDSSINNNLHYLSTTPLQPLTPDVQLPEQTIEVREQASAPSPPVDSMNVYNPTAPMSIPSGYNNPPSPCASSPRVLSKLRPTFCQYLAGGCELELTIAIDFTGSNGDPRKEGTLHHTYSDGRLNDYEKAITAVGTIIARYDSDQKFPVFGFGAKFNGVINHCFQVGPSSELDGISGVIQAYRQVFRTGLTMSGPTVFSEVINKAADEARQAQTKKKRIGQQSYRILLILTDGEVSDVEETKQSIQAACDAPLSIVIVGIGSTNFNAMHFLDDFGAAEDEVGRDICKFVEFSMYQENKVELARATLSEIPDQLVDYFYGREIMPMTPAPAPGSQMTLMTDDASEADEEEVDLSLTFGPEGQISLENYSGTKYNDFTYGTYQDFAPARAISTPHQSNLGIQSPPSPHVQRNIPAPAHPQPTPAPPQPTPHGQPNMHSFQPPAPYNPSTSTYSFQHQQNVQGYNQNLYVNPPVATVQPVQPDRLFYIQTPANVTPGTRLRVTNPVTQQQMIVIVPNGVSPGGKFAVRY